jgi:trk system potassium uptake protein
MNVLIVGCGRVGSRLAVELTNEGNDVTLIDRNPGAFSTAQARGVLTSDFPGNIVVGDGTDADLLRRAGIENADCFIALTEGDNRNIMAAQIAQVVYQVPKVVCRIYDPIRMEIYRKLGMQIYSPTIVGVQVVREILDQPNGRIPRS